MAIALLTPQGTAEPGPGAGPRAVIEVRDMTQDGGSVEEGTVGMVRKTLTISIDNTKQPILKIPVQAIIQTRAGAAAALVP